ncbi:hypothetical protein ACS0PU_000286 [Formica fusca]
MEIDGLRRSKLHLYRIIIGLNKNLLNLSDSATKLLSRIFIHVEKNSRREERRLGVHQIFTEKSIDSMWVKEGIYGGELAQRLGEGPRAIHPRSIFFFFSLRRFRPLAEIGPYTRLNFDCRVSLHLPGKPTWPTDVFAN